MRTICSLLSGIILCCILLSSCHQMYLTEQLAAPDERVPIIIPKDGTYKETQRNLWLHKGNYYTMHPVHYAKENVKLIADRNNKHYYYTDTEKGEYYYFPLTDAEVESCLEADAGSIHQARNAAHLPPLRVKDQNPAEWRQLTMKQVSTFSPDSARQSHNGIGCYRTAAFPVEEGTRGVGRTLLLGPAWVAEKTANVVIWAVEAPLLGIGFIGWVGHGILHNP